jgi:3-phenylpropionate/trans-cinnamate dioxygenase ferredoxin reductase subunit
MDKIVIAGAGQAGFQVAASLRDNGYAGRVVLVGEEPELPYQRPPLSKAYLDGKADEETLRLRPQTFFDEHRIEFLPGESLLRIRAAGPRGRAELGPQARLRPPCARDRVAEPRPACAGADLDGVVQLRTLADAADLKRRLPDIRRAWSWAPASSGSNSPRLPCSAASP